MVDFYNFKAGGKIIIGEEQIPFEKHLYRQTITPMAQGDRKQGFIAFFVAGKSLAEMRQVGTTMTLTCRDVFMNIISSGPVVVTGDWHPLTHSPGLEQ